MAEFQDSMTHGWSRAVRRTLGPALIAAIGIAAPLTGQTFDNFDGGVLETFDLETEALPEDGSIPSLAEDGGLGVGPDIDLRITDGQSDVGIIAIPGTGSPVTSVSRPETAEGTRVLLRALDKTLGRPTDVNMAVGETVMFGRIAIELAECRFPAGDPASDAFAHLAIYDQQGNGLFDGWMIASSPALSALEHPRYDVWVLRCETE